MHLRVAAVGWLVVAVGVSGCGGGSSTTPRPNAPEKNPPGDIPDNQAFVRFAVPGRGFSVKVPEGWSQRQSGGAVVFTDNLNTIRLESRTAAGPLTVAAARRTAVPQLARTVKGYRAGTVSVVDRTAGKALRITYLARSAANPVTGKPITDAVERYVFFHRGHA